MKNIQRNNDWKAVAAELRMQAEQLMQGARALEQIGGGARRGRPLNAVANAVASPETRGRHAFHTMTFAQARRRHSITKTAWLWSFKRAGKALPKGESL